MKGSCLCGEIVFELDGRNSDIELCHCPRCRKAYGTAFAATFYVRAAKFRWAQGADQVVVFDLPVREHPPPYRHVFCRRCGSPLPIAHEGGEFVEIPAGLIDGDPGVRPARHIFTEAPALWWEISDSLPRHSRGAPR